MSGIKLISCVGVDGDLALLPHFLRHYQNLGISSAAMCLILNAESEDTPALAEAARILESFSIKPPEIWIAPYTSGAMWEKRRDLQARIASEQDWVISADVDEFHEYPQSLPSLLRHCDRTGVNCIQGVFIDRLTSTGELLDPSTEESIEERYPIHEDVICSIGQTGQQHDWYGTVKIMACKGNVLPSRGGHHPIKDETPVRFLAGRTLASFPTIANHGFDSRSRFACTTTNGQPTSRLDCVAGFRRQE